MKLSELTREQLFAVTISEKTEKIGKYTFHALNLHPSKKRH